MGSDFGLNLILSFTDKATSGIQQAVGSLNNLTNTAQGVQNSLNLFTFADTINTLGDSFTRAGVGIMNSLNGIIDKVVDTGKTISYAQNQLATLYGGTEGGIRTLSKITDYAKKSIFNFEDLIPIVVMLKANGIEAFDSIASSTGKANQTLMDYAADLAAFNPQMRNAYGTGIQAAMGALNEYISEGNARSLKSGASIDILQMLGEKKGETIQERSRQVADLIEKLGMVGMTVNLAETPMVKLSNMGDTLFQLFGKIASSGVYNAFNDVITVLYDFVSSLSESDLDKIAQSFAGALTAIIYPMKLLAQFVVSVVSGLKTLAVNIPILSQLLVVATALSGTFLIFTGITFKLVASFASMAYAISTLSQSMTTIMGMLNVMKLRMIGIFTAVLPYIAVMAVLYAAWKVNLFGIRDLLSNFSKNISIAFDNANKAIYGSLSDTRKAIDDFGNNPNFFTGLTLGITKVTTLFRALSEGWSNFTLSDDTFKKVRELGLLPIIETIFNLKITVTNFIKDFSNKWNYFRDTIINSPVVKFISDTYSSAFGKLMNAVDMIVPRVVQLYKSFMRFIRLITESNRFKAFVSILSAIGNVVVGTLIPLITGIGNIIVTVFSSILDIALTVFSSVFDTVVGVFSGIIDIISGILDMIVGIFTLDGDLFLQGFLRIGEGVHVIVDTLITAVINILKSVFNGILSVAGSIISTVVDTVIGFVSSLWDNVTNLVSQGMNSVFNSISSTVFKVNEVWNSVTETVNNVWNGIFNTVSSTLNDIWNSVSNTINDIVSGFANMNIEFPDIPLPHFKIEGDLSLKPPFSVPELSVDWYSRGGVFNKPTVIGVGEQGKEAVVPLERNTGWINDIASLMTDKFNRLSLQPTQSGNTSNVVFNEGAIKIVANNSTEEEAARLAYKIMEMIKRQTELDRMTNYE